MSVDEVFPVAPTVHRVRGRNIILDADVAGLFGTETKRLNEQVKRNAGRFGEDYVFRLTEEEADGLKSQTATSNEGRGGRRYLPYAFTDLGVVMAATVLRTDRAIVATRLIVRTFLEMERAKAALPEGSNMPLVLETKGLVGQDGFRQGLMSKINAALSRVMDAMIDPVDQTTVKDEARELILHGLDAIKEHLKTAGLQNEKSLAEIRKILAEVETIHAQTRKAEIDNRHLELALLAKQLRLIVAAQTYAETGTVDTLDAVLRELSSSPA